MRWPARVRLMLVVAALLSQLLGVATAAHAAGEPQLSVLGEESLAVEATEGEETAEGFITLLNSGTTPVEISASFQASSAADIAVGSITPATVSPQDAERVGVTLEGLDGLKEKVSGELVVTGDAVPIAKTVSITPAPQPAAPWPELFILGAFGGSLVLMVAIIGLIPIPDRPLLRKKAVGPKWSFDSWATILTAVGALLAAVVSQVTLPEVPQEIDKDDLVALSLVFAAFLAIGPFVFYAVRPRDQSPADQESGLAGFNVVLLFSCCFTCGAVLGQLATLALLVWELVGGGVWGVAVLALAAVLAGLAVYYSATTGRALATTDWEALAAAEREEGEAAKQAVSRTMTRAAAEGAAPAIVVQRPMRRTRRPSFL